MSKDEQFDVFDTACPVPPEDTERLVSQRAAVRDLMRDGQWRTIAEVAEICGCSEPGASARLRDLRKHPLRLRVERRRKGPGLYEYRAL